MRYMNDVYCAVADLRKIWNILIDSGGRRETPQKQFSAKMRQADFSPKMKRRTLTDVRLTKRKRPNNEHLVATSE